MTSSDPDSFTALADPTRRRILEHLAQTAHMPASDIAAQFTLSKPAISQHLKILKAAQLVSVEVRGQQRIYRLNQAGFDDMSEWITRTRRHWAQALDNLETLLTETPDDDR
ncbi:MAG: metalloregulator ArsR/SmtB family transcription factor [Asticcacaulis sp.]